VLKASKGGQESPFGGFILASSENPSSLDTPKGQSLNCKVD